MNKNKKFFFFFFLLNFNIVLINIINKLFIIGNLIYNILKKNLYLSIYMLFFFLNKKKYFSFLFLFLFFFFLLIVQK